MLQLVSIIMPCHNGEKYLTQAVESVISQTYKNWELIIINDNSTDNSFNIACEYKSKDSRIIVIDNKNSTGFPADPRNIGIKAASGDYIAFLDCDDIWLPEKLEHQLSVIQKENAAVVFSYYKTMNEQGILNSKIIKSPNCVSYGELLNGDCIGNSTGIYDVKKVGKVFQHSIHHEDYLMWLEILKQNQIAVNTNTVEAYYRICKKSISSNIFMALFWNWHIYRKELNIDFLSSCYHMFCYIIKALLKRSKRISLVPGNCFSDSVSKNIKLEQ